jgi:acyl-CoA thioesterase I
MVARGLAAVMIVALAASALSACGAGHADRSRALPANRDAAVVYVALGDSTVEGVAATSPDRNYVSQLFARLHAIYPAARMVNLGRGGAMSADVVAAQLPRAVALRPDLVTLSVGPNDITGGVPVEIFERNVDRILRTLVRDTRAMVVVNLLPDLAVTPRFRTSDQREAVGHATRRFNDALARTARAHEVAVVDLFGASRDEVPRRPELVASDGYHPSDLGYARWAELMWPHIESRIGRR